MINLMSKKSLAISIILIFLCIDKGHTQNNRQLAHDIFKELIEINTTHSTGNTTTAAEAMAARLRAAGFQDNDLFIGGPHPAKGNLVATLRGDGNRKPLLLLAHLDVVEAHPEDWSFDPFKFREIDGYYYARGTTDDKAMAAIWIANLIRFKMEGFVPDRNIIVALTADEEGGEHNGVDWLINNHADLIAAEYALNEGAGGQQKDGKKIMNNVQLSEKVYQSFQLETKNPGGHSSIPPRENAIYRLIKGLDKLSSFEFPVVLNDGTRAFFERSAEIQTGQIAKDMKGLIQTPPDAEAVARLSENPVYNALMRTTCVATMLNAGHAQNALPQTAIAVVNCRILPGEDPKIVLETLIKVLADEQIAITPMNEAMASPPSPLNPEVIIPIEQVTEELWPGVPVVPTMLTGATDGARLRNAGIHTYGVSGLFGDINDIRAHGKDERISITSFYEGQEFLYKLVKKLSTKPSLKRDY